MTLADKRKVIEVLLCAALDPDEPMVMMTTNEASLAIHGKRQGAHHRAWMSTRRAIDEAQIHGLTHGDTAITAAYRLIESSPTLRREWFGAQ